MQYERRPYLVEAFQYTGENLEEFVTWVMGLTEYYGAALVDSVVKCSFVDSGDIHVNNRYGFPTVPEDDWIVFNGEGFEFYSPEHFAALFREVR